MQTNAAGHTYAISTAGEITSWSFRTGTVALPGLKLKVARPQAGGTYLFVGEASAGAQTPNAVNTYPASIPVQPGDVIGFYAALGSTGAPCGIYPGDPTDADVAYTGDPAIGSSPSPFASSTGARFPVSATVTTAISLGTASLNKKKGTAMVPITVPGSGALTLAGKGVVTQSAAQASGVVSLLVKPKGKTSRKLKKKGKAKVNVTISFAGAGGASDSQQLKIKLKER